MKDFLNVVHEIPGIEAAKEFFERTEGGSGVYITGCVESQKAHVAEGLRPRGGIHLIITDDERRMSGIAADCSFFGADTVIYPAKDLIFYSADMHGRQLSARRLACVSKILEVKRMIVGGGGVQLDKHSEHDEDSSIEHGETSSGKQSIESRRELRGKNGDVNLTIVTTIGALTDFLVPLDKYEERTFYIKKGDELDLDEIRSNLVNAGYERKDMVRAPGEWAMRGDILDIYTVNVENPVRIEMWGDTVDAIREFDVSSQRSIENRDGLKVFPASEELFSQEETEKGLKKVQADYKKRLEELGDSETNKPKEVYDACNRLTKEISGLSRSGNYGKFFTYFEKAPCCFTDYLPAGSLVTVEDAGRVFDSLEQIENEFRSGMDYRYKNGYILKKQRDMIRIRKDILKKLGNHRLLLLSSFNVKLPLKPDLQVHVEAAGINAYNNSFDELMKDVEGYKKKGYRIVLAAASASRARRLRGEIDGRALPGSRSPENDADSSDTAKGLSPGNVCVVSGGITRGFSYPEIKFALITENDIYTAGRIKREKAKRKKRTLDELQIEPGDFVAHDNYGIGIYRGICKQTVDNVEKDYIKIDYAGNASVYIPATNTDLLQRYASADTDNPPKIQKIGSVVWKKAKSRARENAEGVAQDLVRLYAYRMSMKGFKYSEDTAWQKEFEELFPFEETQDQLDAIEDVKRDMESDRCMDRLICGDVGFGKTEVALRAAFKAVQDGKQVALLAPTTILAGQHYDTFSSRLRPFPINVVLMSGMAARGENAKAAKALKEGTADIVVGTHRVLSKDVSFKNLGLLIIDEEQRFGVNQKERIKKLKENVDVIALSATPIPRTLNMSLAGIRDMSTLEEPPVDRQPVQTFVSEKNDMIIKEAISREISRGGQVYYIYNRINMMDEVINRLAELMPDVIFAEAHGQMDKKELEMVMTDFINGEIDVLVSTTIVETGLDIPNVNTIIIENADKLGLSQLYQLRGRVGRSSRVAYAFLLFSRERILTDVAEKRLRAISEMTDLGSGYRLAMKDLEIRGAGNLLGKVQSGHMETVGFELYMKMLNEAVAKLKGIDLAESFETTVDISVDAHLPDSYVARENHKLELYKRIAAIETEEDRKQIEDELLDMYGKLPMPALNLLKLALIKALANKAGFTEVRCGFQKAMWITRMEIRMKGDSPEIPDDSAEKLAAQKDMRLVKKEGSRVMVKLEGKDVYRNVVEYLDRLAEMLEGMGNRAV